MKKYLNEIENMDRITVFDELGEFLESDEQGQYFTSERDFDWWNELAGALEKIENYKEDIKNFFFDGSMEDYHEKKEIADRELKEFEDKINSSFNELEDYITIANKL